MPANSTRFKLIKAGRLIDARGDKPIENGAVLLEDSKILQVGHANEISPPDGAPVEEFDFPQGTVLPGLIDVHTHFNYMGDGSHTDDVMAMEDDILLIRSMVNARTHLESGVTTVRECGGKHKTISSLRDGIRQGLILGPKILACVRPITITGGHMWQMGSEADSKDEVIKAVRQVIKEGADFIKVPTTGGSTKTSFPFFPSHNLPELQAIVEEAHKFGKQVATHSRATSGIVNSLDAGVDMIIHCWMQEPDGSWKFQQNVAERIVKEDRAVNPTIYVAYSRILAMRQKIEESKGPSEVDEYGRSLSGAERDFDSLLDTIRRYVELGARLAPGSDSGFTWYPFGQFVHELEYFTHVGMPTMKAIQSATRDAAKTVGISSITGTLEPNKAADVIVVNGNPADNISALSDVQAVFVEGSKVK